MRQVGLIREDAAAEEEARQAVVVGRRDRVELVVVAAGAGDRQAQEAPADRVDLVIDDVGQPLRPVDPAPGPDREHGRRHDPVGIHGARRGAGSRSPATWSTMNRS